IGSMTTREKNTPIQPLHFRLVVIIMTQLLGARGIPSGIRSFGFPAKGDKKNAVFYSLFFDASFSRNQQHEIRRKQSILPVDTLKSINNN
ncbi:hypothetical protein L4D06_23370, partial [Enterovibrio makurazakiensis]|uniref:hypothetical protein n=1 Tax=Enterovibrio makurazakiensis TaxID=2910232 RepID=UPI003D20713F